MSAETNSGSTFGSIGSMYGGMKSRAPLDPIWCTSCTICGRRHEATRLLTVCEACGQMLAVRYDLARVREHAVAHLDYYLDQFTTNVESRGGHVHFASPAPEARRRSPPWHCSPNGIYGRRIAT